MIENPYCPPNYDPGSLLGPDDVVVHSRFPLDITAQRTICVEMSEEMLERRVQSLFQSCGFAMVNRSDRKWTFLRGSLWNALYTFDIRKLPTTVVLEMISATQLSIWLRVYSVLTVSTIGDSKRLSQELNELEMQFVKVGKQSA